MLDEQRLGIINQVTYELGTNKNNASNAVQNSDQPLDQKYMELSSLTFDFEISDGSQLRLLADLRDREEVNQAELSHLIGEVEYLRSV